MQLENNKEFRLLIKKKTNASECGVSWALQITDVDFHFLRNSKRVCECVLL